MSNKGENPDVSALDQTNVNPDLTAPIPVIQKTGELTDEELGSVAGGTGAAVATTSSKVTAKYDQSSKNVVQSMRG